MTVEPARETPYPDAEAHFRDWTALVLLHLRRALLGLQEWGMLPLDPGGWHSDRIDEREVRGVLAEFRYEQLVSAGWSEDNGSPDPIGRLRDSIAARVEASRRAGTLLPLVRLQQTFDLDDTELLLVVATLLPQVFGHLERLYRFLQDDFHLTPMTPYLALRLLAAEPADWLRLRRLFFGPARLFQLGLLRWEEGEEARPGSSLYRRFGLGLGLVGELLPPGPGRPAPQSPTPQDSVLPVELPDWILQVQALVQESREGPGARRSPSGQGRQESPAGPRWQVVSLLGRSSEETVQLLAQGLGSLGLKLKRVALTWPGPPEEAPAEPICEQIRAVLRGAMLEGALLCLTRTEFLARVPGLEQQLARLLEQMGGPSPWILLLLGEARLSFPLEAQLDTAELGVTIPSPRGRARSWQAAVPKGLTLDKGLDLELIASAYPFGEDEIRRAMSVAVARARRRGSRPRLTLQDVREGCRRLLGQDLSRLAVLVESRHTLDDLVLPERLLLRLQELIAFVRNRSQVLEAWGVGEKLQPRSGVSALFHGPPGTGKSLAASVIAGQLGMLLYRIDLSRVVDKYIGETEKRLEQIFRTAEDSLAVLLFDEADAVFSARTAVKGSVDRYSNMEVNYLLQRMESFDGIVILTTNLPDSMDEAFKRRLDFKLEFPFPGKEERLALWKALWPAKVPTAKNLPLRELADEYEMSGGSIRNAIVRACFMAADRNEKISAALLRQAAVVEIEESGRLVRQ